MKPLFLYMVAGLCIAGCSNSTEGEVPIDNDGDGYTANEDCDDNNPRLWDQCDAVAGANLCAGGGWVEGDGVRGMTCTGPLELSSQPSSNGQYTWYPGPHHLITEENP